MLIVDPSFEILDELETVPLVERIETCGRICYKSEDKITSESAIPFVKKIIAHGHNSVTEMAALSLKFSCSKEQRQDFFNCQPKYLVIDEVDDHLLVTGTVRGFREFYLFNKENEVALSCISFLSAKEPYLFKDLYDSGEVESDIEITKLSLKDVDALTDELFVKHRFLAVKFITNRAVTHELVRHRPVSYLQESQRYCRYNQDKFGNQVSFIKPVFFDEDTEEYKNWVKAMEEAEKLYLKLLETSSPQAARTVLPNSCKTEIIAFCNLLEWKHIFSQRTTKHAEPSMRELMVPLMEEMQKRYSVI